MSFYYRGIYSKLDFIQDNRHDIPVMVDFLYTKYQTTGKITCEIVLHDRDKPEFFGDKIALVTDPSLVFYQQIDFQLAHELTHLMQYHLQRIKIERLEYNNPFEIEARMNSKLIMHTILNYPNYPIDE
jgi:hypothetical protein